MKRKIILITFILLGFFVNESVAQKKFNEGKIVYTITYPDMELDAQTAAMMPNVMTLYIKGNKTRMEMKMGMGMSNVTISDGDKKMVTSLIDAMGQKYAMQMTEEEIKKESGNVPTPDISKTDETREIAGLKCEVSKVTLVDSQGNKTDSEICVSRDFILPQNQWNDQNYKDIDGLMLEYDIQQGQMKMKLKAKSVKEEAVAESMFEIPDGYEMKTREELMQMR